MITVWPAIESLFLFSLTHICELFSGYTFEMEILIDLQVLRSPESENNIFSVWSVCMCACVCVCVCVCVSVCACVCAYVCYQHNSKTNCSKNIKFTILHLYHIQMLHEIFYKDRTKTPYTGTQNNSNNYDLRKEFSFI